MNKGADPAKEPGVTAAYSPGSNPDDLEELGQHFPQFEILELLGQGGMGIVYKARQRRLDRFVALKILPDEASRAPSFAERFAREARALAKLTHPNIVAVYDFGESDGRSYLVMEFVDGVNMRHLLRERRLKPEEALKIVPQICEALQYAHEQGVVHRDIKPENILLDKRGQVKIADFGLVKLLGPKAVDSALTGSEQIVGTLHYMAPEQVERPLTVDHRADIYSLGVVFYEMLTGELPLGRFAPPSQKAQVDVRLDEVVLRALEKEPDRRYQHASDVKAGVESVSASPTLSWPNEFKKADAPWSATAHEKTGKIVDKTWHRWVMLGVVGWIYVISLLLPAYKVIGTIHGGNNAGGEFSFILNGWSCIRMGNWDQVSWWANPVLLVGFGLLAFRKWLWSAVVAQVALLLALYTLADKRGDPLPGYWIWLTSMAVLSGCGFYGLRTFRRCERARQITSSP